MDTTLTDEDFEVLRDKANDLAWIDISGNKKAMLLNRVKARVVALQLKTVNDYIHYLTKNPTDENQNFINVVTTTMSHFYREHHHYEYLIKHIEEIDRKANKAFAYSIWSAGCSSGEESYTLAMILKSRDMHNCRPIIQATDINTQMLVAAREGYYRWSHISELPSMYVEKYLEEIEHDYKEKIYQVKSEIREMVQIKRINLMDSFKSMGKFDVIFCRNVMIYFSEEDRIQTIKKFIKALNPGGFFITGHSEVFDYKTMGLECVGKTIYKKGE